MRLRWGWYLRSKDDKRFFTFLLPFAGIIFGVFVLTFLVFLGYSYPVFLREGLSFLTSWDWDPEGERYGVLAGLYGSVLTAAIAISIAVPLSISFALFVNEIAPRRIRSYLISLMDLMAGVPTIIYGIWGLEVLAPLLLDYLERPLGFLIYGREPLTGYNYFTAGVMLASMITPFVSSVVRESYASIPATYREALYALGATRFEASRVLISYIRPALITGVVLGFGRALGETAAVTLVIGNRIGPPSLNVFDSGVTVTSLIATQFPFAFAYEYAIPALFGAGLILLLIGFSFNLAALLLTRRWVRKIGRI